MLLIFVKLTLYEAKLRENLDCCGVSWLNDDVDEARRCFGNVCRLSVHELTHWEVVLLFKVALSEEFTVEQVSPLL